MVADTHSRRMLADTPLSTPRAAFRPLLWFRRRLLRKPASTLAMSVAALLGGVIAMNALALQTDRHPAPMFTSMIDERAALPAVEPVPLPPVRPDAAERRREVAAKEPRPAPAQREEAGKVPASAKDQMLAIIRGGAPETNESSQRIVQVQKSLNRAGYGPLKEDGMMGPGTRQALEKFEADRKLPVKGEPQGRTLRELARASGLAIE